MAKLVFPGVGAPYRGFIGEVRGWLTRIASYTEKSPGSIAAINSQLQVLATKTGFVPALLSTQKIVADNEVVPIQDAAGNAKGNGAVTIVAGVITRVRPASTVAVIQSTVKVLAPAITGTWVNGYTFTVVNGAITAIAAS